MHVCGCACVLCVYVCLCACVRVCEYVRGMCYYKGLMVELVY